MKTRKKSTSKETLLLRNRALQNAIKALVKLYIANPGTDGEFIACIASVHLHDESASAKRVRNAWDEARSLIQP